jgi:hypothetical protein
VGPWQVTVPLGLQGGDPRPRGADPGDLESFISNAGELVSQQDPEGHVNGRDVSDTNGLRCCSRAVRDGRRNPEHHFPQDSAIDDPRIGSELSDLESPKTINLRTPKYVIWLR